MLGTGNVDKKRHDSGKMRGRHANSKHNNNWCKKSQSAAILHNPRNRFLSSGLLPEARASINFVSHEVNFGVENNEVRFSFPVVKISEKYLPIVNSEKFIGDVRI